MILTILLLLFAGFALLMETKWHPHPHLEAIGTVCIILFIFLGGYYVFAHGYIPLPSMYSSGGM